MNARVKDVMTTRVVAVHTSASFKEMAARLRQHRVSAFPVVDDDGKVIGVVSEADLLAKEVMEGGHEDRRRRPGILHRKEQEKAAGTTAADLMTKPPATVGPDDLVTHAARLMYERRVKRLPVVDDDGKLVGIVSRTDVLSVFSRPDEDIRREITENVILNEFLTDPTSFTVSVKDGIVTMQGWPESAYVGHNIIDEIRHVEGVVAVRDRLVYPPADPAPAGPLF